MNPLRLAILCDFPEENWVSMNLVAEMLWQKLHDEHADSIDAQRICPPFRRRATSVGVTRDVRIARNFDRVSNRLRDYPRFLATISGQYSAFHVADHSYAALVHALPAERTGVFCHDLDAFRSILDPHGHRRPKWFRAMTGHILKGMQKAAVVFYTTDDVGRQIRRHGLIDPTRLVQAPLGVAEEFTAGEPDGQVVEQRITNIATSAPFILHVGSCIKRKRIDVLLDVLAELRRRDPRIRMIKVGGEWSGEQSAQLRRLALADRVSHFQGIDRATLAWLYRRAAAVLVTSESEGFGLPVIEALACAAPVIASDIPVLREVGADAVTYCPIGDVDAWATAVMQLVADPSCGPARATRFARAEIYTWRNHANIIASTYIKLVEGG